MYQPVDHLPASLRDRNCVRRDDEISRRKEMFKQARRMAAALRTVIVTQRRGKLTRSDGEVLSVMILQNLRACVRGEQHYRPSRARIAGQTGYSERTVSQCIGRLKAAGIIVVARYAKGGRLGNFGKGLSTEFRSG